MVGRTLRRVTKKTLAVADLTARLAGLRTLRSRLRQRLRTLTRNCPSPLLPHRKDPAMSEDNRTDEEKRQARVEEENAWARRQAEENAARSGAEAKPAEQQPAEPLPDQKGAQIVLDPESDASRAARGTMYPTQEENAAVWDAEVAQAEREAKVAEAEAKLAEVQEQLEAARAARDEYKRGA